ncbi:DUF4373 domain-containing protein [Shewanella eurypsychrophilus]|uniref:DUF4373 domain-containing protein n=1 Tax=Shewanella eurypsychrophilus TaxID=2593656 RepID=A0ABX6V102_9GAMM|nr:MULTISPECIES: Lin1244/Lin1753 domain-containing protein [Shewanella]QFU20696.1 DUF4373 domain-containing protein [Shewanella sp. YLB-09]QFU20976.1 DUF4373 domain-containing protein [Shewanella sp. YLB-09]QPG56264.1 DUF4373 domain-containing protein [Shewanella eurypsychrophilus]
MKWFKHDTNANMDAKLQMVLLDHGLDGYGLYWYCLELIAGKVDSSNITFRLEHDARIIARNTGCSEARVSEMMKYFINSGLFEVDNGLVTCLKLAKRLDQSMTSSKDMRNIIKEIRLSHGSIMTGHDSVMKEENRIEEKRRDKSTTGDKSQIDHQQVVNTFHESLPMLSKVEVYSDARRKSVKSFFKKRTSEKGEIFTIETLQVYFEFISENCGWMLEDRPNPNTGGVYKKRNFDFIMSDRCYVAVKERQYDDVGCSNG